MARLEILQGWNIGARKLSVPVESGRDGQPAIEERWELSFIENGTANRITFLMEEETRNMLVKQLTGGVILAGGDLPRL